MNARVPAADPGSALPPHWHRGTFMQIFVRAWRDADGDGIGDLRGIIQGLPYLQELGVSGIWLMPIHPSQDGDHGYAVTDYRAIHPDYGTLEDFDELLREAHARGIGVILDYVINHCAATHPLFELSRSGADSPTRDWFIWREPHPAGWRIHDNDPWRRDGEGSYFAAFSRHMPDFNWLHPDVAAWHHDNLRFWLNRGVDGFRFDAVGHLVENSPDDWDCQPQNYPIMAAIRALLDGYEQRFMVCEAPGDPGGFARMAGSAFAFDLNADLLALAGGQVEAVQRVARYFERAPHGLGVFLSNHDSFAGARVHDQLRGRGAQMRLAAAACLLLPGTPFVYYGEEIGLAGHRTLPGDYALRTPMSWTDCPQGAGFTSGRPFRALSPNSATHNVAVQRDAPGSLLAFYRALIGLRRTRESLLRGDYRVLAVQGAAWAFARRHGSQCTVVALNAGSRQTGLRLEGLPADAVLEPLLEPLLQPQQAPPAGQAGTAQALPAGQALWLPPHGVGVYALHPRP